MWQLLLICSLCFYIYALDPPQAPQRSAENPAQSAHKTWLERHSTTQPTNEKIESKMIVEFDKFLSKVYRLPTCCMLGPKCYETPNQLEPPNSPKK
eukprot:5200242-Amphidinium_carterae.1